nr:quinone oxidoreductase-like protein 2 isoform X4 [Peromyscus maniculatus bairdii]
MAARLCARHLPPVWLCRRAAQGQGRHYRAALCAELKHPLITEEVASRPVGPQEVRVDVHFCGINFADILVCRGQYQEKPPLPFIPGIEFSGAVLETGTDVSTVKKGDRVIGVSNFNAMAEECITDQKTLWRIPENVSLQDAAVLPVSYGTAILALEHRARAQPGVSCEGFCSNVHLPLAQRDCFSDSSRWSHGPCSDRCGDKCSPGQGHSCSWQ